MAEIASFVPRKYPHGSCRGAKEARSAVATVTSALPLFEPCPFTAWNIFLDFGQKLTVYGDEPPAYV
jgi:hypothetical protein